MTDTNYAFTDSKCPRCNGEGKIIVFVSCEAKKGQFTGMVAKAQICPECHGMGIIDSLREVPCE